MSIGETARMQSFSDSFSEIAFFAAETIDLFAYLQRRFIFVMRGKIIST
jgi:hypothetical protein